MEGRFQLVTKLFAKRAIIGLLGCSATGIFVWGNYIFLTFPVNDGTFESIWESMFYLYIVIGIIGIPATIVWGAVLYKIHQIIYMLIEWKFFEENNTYSL